MNTRITVLSGAALAALFVCLTAAAPQDKPASRRAAPSDAQPEDVEEQIVSNADAFVEAYNKHDAKAIAAQYAAAGEFVDQDGNVFSGPETIQEEFAAFFEAYPETKIDMEV